MEPRTWANPEIVLREMLAEKRGHLAEYGVVLPGNLGAHFPYHRITLVRGADDTINDTTVVDIESFAASRNDASNEAEAIRSLMLQLSGTADAKGRWLIDSVNTLNRPAWKDYRNPDVHRYVATYEVTMRPLAV